MTITEPTGPQRLKMSGLHMAAVISGVLAVAASNRLFENIDLLWWGIAALAGGIALILVGAVGLGRSIRTAPVESAGYPTKLEGQLDPTLSRGLWLVKWLLAIPHYIVLIFLGLAAIVVVIIAWFAILFTGRYPEGMFNFVVGVIRWTLRVQGYAFLLVTDQYPPFSLD